MIKNSTFTKKILIYLPKTPHLTKNCKFNQFILFTGCDAGVNHFEDEESCLEECVNPKGPKVCFLPKNKGSCQGVYNEWFFDMEKTTCSPFVHSGCLGNGNRFLTKGMAQPIVGFLNSIQRKKKLKAT